MENLISILNRFIKSEYDNVFLLKGDWGIGKTYFWNLYEDQFKKTNAAYLYYSKVSLYGAKDTSDVYRKIIFSSDSIQEKKTSKSIFDRAKSLGKKASNFVSQSPYIKDYVGDILVDYSISKINDSIIVLDDFERISRNSDKGVSDQFEEIFGLVNDLKQKGNKVIIISNIKNEYDELINHIEKNVDIEFLYEPKIENIIESIFNEEKYDGFIDTIKDIANNIELRNMRAIKKLKRNINFLLDRTSHTTLTEILPDLALYTLGRFSQNKKLPAYEKLINTNPYSLFFTRDDVSDKEKEASQLATKYINVHNEELKNILLKLIEFGFVEPHLTDELKNHFEDNVENRERLKSYNKAWDYYHNSYENDEDKFIDLMYDGCKKNLDQIDPRNFESSIQFLEELGESEKKKELLEEYFEVNQERFKDILTKNIHRLPMSFEVKTDEMRKRINLLREENKEVRSIEEIIKKITYASGWGGNDEDELANHSIDDYEKFIRETKSEDLDAYIRRLIKFGEFQNPSKKQLSIKEKTIEALKRIHADGGLNKFRIEKKYNIED
ncbi:MAG: P-loop NTPase fold protein [Candidatus Paceibacterota bacterium]